MVLIGKCIILTAYISQEEISKINNLSFHLSKLEKEQIKYKVKRRKEILRIIAENNKIKNENSIEKILKKAGI